MHITVKRLWGKSTENEKEHIVFIQQWGVFFLEIKHKRDLHYIFFLQSARALPAIYHEDP